MATNVDFYEKLKDVQEFQHNSESKRLELEKQLNQYMQSDHRLARLKAVRLQNYWKKLCEDEKRSEWRNEQLLKDIERVENQMTSLAARTDRLKIMKRQYEEYIERVYPQWKEKVLVYQELKKQQAQKDLEKYATAALSLQHGSDMPVTGFQMTSTPHVNRMGLGQQQQSFSGQQVVGNQQMPQQQPLLLQQQIYQHKIVTQPVEVPEIKVMGPLAAGGGSIAPTGSTMQTVSDLPTGYSLASNLNQQHQESPQQQGSFGTMESPAYGTGGYEISSDQIDDNPNVVEHAQDWGRQRDDDMWKSEELPSNTSREEPVVGDPARHYANVPPHPDDDFADTSEFASDVELPLSGQEECNEKSQPTPRSARTDSVKSKESADHNVVSRQISAGRPGTQSRQQSVESEIPIYPQADVTLEGLYNLLAAVQDTFAGAFSSEEYYRDQLPPMSVRKDVISNANRGATLSHLGGESMSMVVLDQLPLVVLNCEGSCLLRDDFLNNPPTTITPNLIRTKVHLTSQTLWDKIYEHLVKVIKYNIMNASEASTIFAPLLIARDSPYEEQAIQVLINLLENLPNEELQPSPNSTATLSSLPLSPKGKPSFNFEENNVETKELVAAHKTDSPPPRQQEMSSIPLTQTAAYRQLLGDTASSQKSITYEHSDDDSSVDSVEKALQAHSLAASPRSDATPLPRKESEPMIVPTGDHFLSKSNN